MVHIQAIAALALLPASVLGGNFQFPKINVKLVQGQSTATTTYSTETQVSCSTILVPFPPIFPVVTKTFTSIIPDLLGTTVTSTSTPVVTVTPAPVQIINNVTSLVTQTVDGPPATDITKITSTIISSVVSTIVPPLATVTLTIVDTSTSYTSTSTVASSAGFLGVLQTGLPTLSNHKREDLLNARIAWEEQELARQEIARRSWISGILGNVFGWGSPPPPPSNNPPPPPPGPGGNPPPGPGNNPPPNSGWGPGGGQSPNPFLHGLPWLPNPGNLISWRDNNFYPLGVTCLAKVIAHKIITVVVVCETKTTTLKPSTVIKTSTTTVTNTSTRIPNTVTVSTTVSTTQTNTISVTAPQNTFIATTTTTAILEQVSSYYEACGNNNLLGPTLPALFNEVAGDVITDVLYDASSLQLVTTDGNTQYDCCRQCIVTKGCTFGGFMPAGVCYLHVTKDNSCPAQSSEIGEYVVAAPPQDQVFGVYNGYCGALGYGGLDSNI